MLTITLSDAERIMLADAVEVFMEAASDQLDPDALTALALLEKLHRPEDMANDPTC